MLLTKKSEYALLSLISIMKSEGPKNVDALSKELDISKSFLAKIMQNLAKNEIVKSYKGVNGGFTLNKLYNELTILEITTAAEEKEQVYLIYQQRQLNGKRKSSLLHYVFCHGTLRCLKCYLLIFEF